MPLGSTVQVETCARCHSHRQPLQAVHEAGHSFLDTHDPSVLSESLYQPDGQIREEVYVYGSFLQAGCTCRGAVHRLSPPAHHEARRIRECPLCPLSSTGEIQHSHPSFSSVGSTGASYVDCHMPVKHYMVVDGQRSQFAQATTGSLR
ncbi:MAG: hypothetical protein R3F31_07825 [Verrucomicrobiales bacterium]